MSNRGVHFVNEIIELMMSKFLISHKNSAPYHPQENGQAKSTNKTLCIALTRVVSQSRSGWEQKPHSILWAYCIAYKTSIDTTLFDLVYGLNAIIPLEFLTPTLQVATNLDSS